jgi:small subunit ribosomal protein S2
VIQKLNDAGVYHYWQLAAMTPADEAKLDQDLKLSGRIGREGWVEQAKALLAS